MASQSSQNTGVHQAWRRNLRKTRGSTKLGVATFAKHGGPPSLASQQSQNARAPPACLAIPVNCRGKLAQPFKNSNCLLTSALTPGFSRRENDCTQNARVSIGVRPLRGNAIDCSILNPSNFAGGGRGGGWRGPPPRWPKKRFQMAPGGKVCRCDLAVFNLRFFKHL